MMRNNNDILLNTFAMEARMNCHPFVYLVETVVPSKLDDFLGFFFLLTDTTFSTKKKKKSVCFQAVT